MNYPVVDLGSVRRPVLGQATPLRIALDPMWISTCDTTQLQVAVDNAASRIAYYQAVMQAAVQAGDQSGISAASAGSNLANNDWLIASKVLKQCQGGGQREGSETSRPPLVSPVLMIGALVLAVAVVGAVLGPKILK